MAARTRTLNDDVGIAPPVFEPIVALRVLGIGRMLPLPPDAVRVRLGSAARAASSLPAEVRDAATVVVPDDYVSKTHALLELVGGQLRVTNLSKNGVRVDGARRETVLLAAGAAFRVGQTELLALTPSAVGATGMLHVLLGLRAHAVVDRALRIALGAWSAAIVGHARTGVREVAPLLHSVSRLRARPLLSAPKRPQVEQVVGAFYGVQVFDTAVCQRLPSGAPGVVEILRRVDPRAGMPSYFVGNDPADLERHVGVRLGDDLTLPVPSMRDRPGEGGAVIAALLRGLAPEASLADLGAANCAALDAHKWPRDMDELRLATTRIAAILGARGNLRAAASALGVHHSTLQEWAAHLGLQINPMP